MLVKMLSLSRDENVDFLVLATTQYWFSSQVGMSTSYFLVIIFDPFCSVRISFNYMDSHNGPISILLPNQNLLLLDVLTLRERQRANCQILSVICLDYHTCSFHMLQHIGQNRRSCYLLIDYKSLKTLLQANHCNNFIVVSIIYNISVNLAENPAIN